MDSHLEQRSVSDWLAEIDAEWDALSKEEQDTRRKANKEANEKWLQENGNKSLNQLCEEAMLSCMNLDSTWSYRDLPRLTKDLFDEFISIVGAENIQWLTQACYPTGWFKGQTEPLYRGQCFISEVGMANIRNWS